MDYITCNRTKSKYKISVDICSVCKHNKRCPDYKNYIQPSLFPESSTAKRMTKATFRKRRKSRGTKPDPLDLSDKAEQLRLNI
jgi:hypothetical protein